MRDRSPYAFSDSFLLRKWWLHMIVKSFVFSTLNTAILILLSSVVIYSERALHPVRWNALRQLRPWHDRPYSICPFLYSLLRFQIFASVSMLEKELKWLRQTLKPLKNTGFSRLSLLYRSGIAVPVFCMTKAGSWKISKSGCGIQKLRQPVIFMFTSAKIAKKSWEKI